MKIALYALLLGTSYLIPGECIPDHNGSSIFFDINTDQKKLTVSTNNTNNTASLQSYPLSSRYVVVGERGFADYRGHRYIDFICAKRYATIYVDTSERNSENLLIIYAAHSVTIHDYGPKARIFDVDYWGSTYYANSYLLHYIHPFLHALGTMALVAIPSIATPLLIAFMIKSQQWA